MARGFWIVLRQGLNAKQEFSLNSDTSSGRRLISAAITKSVDSYPSFTFSLDPSHREYANIHPFTSFVRVFRPYTGDLMFEGRVLTPNDQMDSSGSINKDITCEGLEGFLHDSVPPFKIFHDTTPKQFLQWYVDEHNKQVEDYKKLKLGIVTVTNNTDNVYRVSDETKDTYENIKDKLIDRLGGEIRVRHVNDELFLDYMPTIGKTNNQDITLSRNMVSLARTIDPQNVVTVLKPLGATQEPADGSSSNETEDVSYPRLNIAGVNGGSLYLKDQSLIDQFGVHVQTQTWEDVTTAAALLSKGRDFLNNQAPINTQLQVGYVDLALITPKKFMLLDCGDTVRINNKLQGIDMVQRITGTNLDCLNVANSSITLGSNAMSGETYEAMVSKQRSTERNQFLTKLQGYQRQLADLTAALGNAATAEQIKKLQDQIDEINRGNWTAGTQFMDISDYQSAFTQQNFDTLYSQGIKGVIIKLTQGSEGGTAYVNKYFATQKEFAAKANMKFIGTYHYLTSTSVADAQDEAKWYLKQLQASNVPKSTIVACDVEDAVLTSDKATLTNEVKAFHKVLSDAGYTNTTDYSGASWIGSRFTSEAKYKWIASWGISNPPAGADAWQYNNTFNGLSLDVDKSYNKAFI